MQCDCCFFDHPGVKPCTAPKGRKVMLCPLCAGGQAFNLFVFPKKEQVTERNMARIVNYAANQILAAVEKVKR